MQDQRQTARRRALSTVRLSWSAGDDAVEAVLRDTSEGGAMLLVDEPMTIPSHIDVTDTAEGRRSARVVWRSGLAVGVAFAAPTARDPAAAQPNDRVVSLDAARRARDTPGDAERLAARIAAVLRRSDRPRPSWL